MFSDERLRRAAERPAGWKWQHEHQAELLNRDGLMCEQHPGLAWPHGDCAGPGMPWMVEGRAAIGGLHAELERLRAENERLRQELDGRAAKAD